MRARSTRALCDLLKHASWNTSHRALVSLVRRFHCWARGGFPDRAAALPAVLLLMHAVLWHVHAGDGMSGLKWIARDRDGVAGREVRAARAKGGRAAPCMAVDICSVCVVGQNVSGKF
jgi:hypothetical protein